MKPAPFAYHRPDSLAGALEVLAGEPEAKVLAGGQSLLPLLSMRLASPAALVDIGRLPGLDRIEVTDAGVRVGALVRHADLLAHDGVRRVQPLVAMALGHVAHPTIRNRGTTVGSVVHADPAAEMPVVLRLLGGTIDAASQAGTRTVTADELFVGPLETSLRSDEVATSAWFPALPPDAGVGFAEVSRRHGDYALVGVAALVRLAPGEEAAGEVVEARAGYLSVAEVPTVVDLTGVAPEDAGAAALGSLDPDDDVHATAAYRRQLVRVLTARVLQAARAHAVARAAGRAGGGGR